MDWKPEEVKQGAEALLEVFPEVRGLGNFASKLAEHMMDLGVSLFLARASEQVKEDVAIIRQHMDPMCRTENLCAACSAHRQLARLSALAQEAESLRGVERAQRDVYGQIKTITSQRDGEDTISAVERVAKEAEACKRDLQRALNGLVIVAEVLTSDKKEPAINAARRVVAERDDAQKETEALRAKVAPLTLKVNNLEQANDDLHQQLAAMQRMRDAARSEVARLKADLARLGKAGESLHIESEGLEQRALSAEASRQALLSAGEALQERLDAVEADREGWRLVAIRALILHVMVRAQWERYVDIGKRTSAERLQSAEEAAFRAIEGALDGIAKEREAAVQPFLQLARDRIARESYEPIPLEACSRLLEAFNAAPEKESKDA